MNPFNFQKTIRDVIARNIYFPVCMGFFMGFFCSDLYALFTGKDLFNVWHDRLFGIVSICAGIYALYASRKNAFTPFLLDTLGGLGLVGAGLYYIVS